MKSLFVFAAATAAVLTSAAIATPGPGTGISHHVRHLAGRLTALTVDQAMMCTIPEVPSGHVAGPLSGPPLRVDPKA